MASVVLHDVAQRFGTGTTVAAYQTAGTPASGPPAGVPIAATAVVQPNGTLSFGGLVDGVDYVAYANVGGIDHYVRFQTTVSKTARYANTDPEDVTFRSDAPAGQIADVFQQFVGGEKVVFIDGDGVLHFNGIDAGGVTLQKQVSVVSLGDLTGSAIVDLIDESEVWVFLTLTGDATLTLKNLVPSRPVRVFASRDNSGNEYTLTISNLTVSTDAELDRYPNSTTVLSIYAEEADDLVIAGGSSARPSRALAGDAEVLSSDAGRLLTYSSAANPKLRIAAGLSFRSGDEVRISQTGPGQVRVTADVGVTVWSDGFLRGIGRGARAVLLCVGPDEYILAGSLSSVYAQTAGVPDAVTAIPNKKLWLDSLQLALAEAAAITPWADKSGAGNDATQATAGKRATLHKGKINGFPAATFDGVDDWYTVNGIAADDATRTIWSVVAPDSLAPGHRYYAWALTDGGHALYLEAGNWVFGHKEGGGAQIIGAASALDVLTTRFNSVASCDVYINGVFALNFDPDDAYSTSGGLKLGIGASDNGDGSTVFGGVIPETIVSSDAVSEPVRTAVDAYLLAKYGK